MSGELRNFNPNKVSVIWKLTVGGTIDLTRGLVNEDTAIQETKTAELWSSPRADRQGNAVRNLQSDRTGALALTYVAESEIQDELSAIVLLDALAENQTGTITIKDNNGPTLMIYVGAYIQNDPSPTWGAVAGNRVYTFAYAERIPFLGGSSAV